MRLRWIFATIAILQVVFFSSAKALIITADADGYTEGEDISNVFPGMTLSSIGRTPGLDGHVYAYSDALASTGTMVFGHNLPNHTEWYFDAYPEPYHLDDFALRVAFDEAAQTVSMDLVSNGSYDYGGLDAYNAQGEHLTSILTPMLTYGQVYTLTVIRQSYDIAYVVAGGIYANEACTVLLDNISADVIPEPATVLMLSFGGLAILRRRRRFIC